MRSREGLLYSPIAHTLIGLVLGIAGMSMSPDAPESAVFAVNMTYAIGSPILIALRRWWLVNAILCAVGMFVLLVIMPVLGAMVARLTSLELGSALIVPTMIFPCALVLSGVLRFVIVRRERAAAEQAAA